MEIDRRRLLLHTGMTAAAAAAGALVASGRSCRPSTGRPPIVPPLGAAMAGVPAPVHASRWAAPRPPIVSRAQWQTDRLKPPAAQYTAGVRGVFVHHTDGGDDYGSRQVPGLIRSIYSDHRGVRDWDDIGYNFLIDRDGTIYEGRHGGIDRPVVGAHTLGFNHETVGIAAIGTYTKGTEVPPPVLNAIAAVAAWKLGMYGIDPRGVAELVSTSNKSRFPTGTRHTFAAISGHRDAFCTLCPGEALYAALPRIREAAARLQGRLPAAGSPPAAGTGRRPGAPSKAAPGRGPGAAVRTRG